MSDADFVDLALRRAHRFAMQVNAHSKPLNVLTLDPTDASRLGRMSEEQIQAVVSTALESIDGLVAPMQRHSLDPALTPLGPWRPPNWMRPLGVVSELPGQQESEHLSFVSRTHALCGHHILHIDTVLSESSSPHGYGWSTIATDGTQLIKTEVCSTEYLERAQVPGEAWFLHEHASRRVDLRLPELRVLYHGQGVNAMLREHLKGTPLIGAPTHGRQAMAADLLALQVAWASAGLSHNDLRPWNLLAGEGGVRLVDFADSGAIDSDVDRLPQAIALAGLLAWIIGMPFPSGPDFAGQVRAEAEAVLGRGLPAYDPRQFRWGEQVIGPWASYLDLPANKAFETMVLSASGVENRS